MVISLKNNNYLKVEKDWKNLKKVKNKDRTEELCDLAFSQNYEAIEFIPNRLKYKYSREVMSNDWNLYRYCDLDSLNLDDWKKIIFSFDKEKFDSKSSRKVNRLILRLLDRYSDDNELNKEIEKYSNFEVTEKKYEDNHFIVIKRDNAFDKKIKYTFTSFEEFYNFLDGNLENADIYDYDFKGINLKNYDLKNIPIKSEILIKNNMYDDSFYKNIINPLCSIKKKVLNNNESKDVILHENEIQMYKYNEFACPIYYISDIHLDEKLLKKFKNNCTEIEVRYYIKKIVNKMFNSMLKGFYNNYLMIAGDVSSSFTLSKIFYEELSSRIIRGKFFNDKIIVVLGNHELWDSDQVFNSNYYKIVDGYRKMLEDLGIILLHNDLATFTPSLNIIKEEQLKSISKQDLIKKCSESIVNIFGGLGFSGFNPSFNASQHIYLSAIPDLEKDKELTSNFFDIYKKIKTILYKNKMIVLTHTPKSDWATDDYNPNWIYISGHTHVNYYEKNQYRQIYSDNQVGYYNEIVYLKRIDYTTKCNIYINYEDGIYELDSSEYCHFYFKLGYHISCNLKYTIYLLKKDDLYMFVTKNEKGNLFIMNGGMKNRLSNNDINYYYENMSNYSNLLKNSTNSYYEYINKISNYIKSIGGYGTVHGAIVDIDFYNHIYLNIYDGKITPYWAASVDYKIIYPNLKELLQNQCPKLLENINSTQSNELALYKNELIPNEGVFVEDTRMYKESRIIRRIQYLIDDNIIRVWNDNLINNDDIKLLD